MQISPKLELCRANQDQIRNQLPRLRRNRLFLGRKEGYIIYFEGVLIDAFSRIVVQKGRLIGKYMSLLFEEIPLSQKLELCLQSKIRFGISDLAYVGIHYF